MVGRPSERRRHIGHNRRIEPPAPGPNPIQTDPTTGITYAWNGYGWVPMLPVPAAGNGMANTARSFGVVVEFEEPSGGQQQARTFVINVPPAGTSDWQVETTFDVAAGTDCRVVEVTKLL